MSMESEKNLNDPNRITYIGNVDYRNKMIRFGIKAKDRTKHLYVIGKSGMGKSTLLENMAIQDIQNGEGIAFMDPHGGTAEKLLDFVPEHRKKDVIYFAPFDTEYPVALNVLEKVDISKRHLVANGLMAAFKKVFGEDKFSDRMQYILNNIILTLLENDDETLIGINRILSDKEYRRKMVENVKDPSIKSFWLEEYAKAGEKYQQEAAPAIQNKIGQFTSNPLIRNIIGQKKTSFDIRDVMDNKKILIMNLSKGKMGEGNANLIGSLLITKIYLAAMSRADVDPYKLNDLPPFYFYVDEFQNFANDSFANILSEARKYQLALTVAHQYVDQMTDEVKSAIFGNVGTMITFRVGATDAEVFEKEFAPFFTADDIVNLSAFQMYLRLMIDSVGSKPFSAIGLPPIEKPDISYSEEIVELSRHTFGKAKDLVENEIKDAVMPTYKKIKKEIKKIDKKDINKKIKEVKKEVKKVVKVAKKDAKKVIKVVKKNAKKSLSNK
jgi:energy-coupling factor transporter ATP-binding protein EcfA2